MEFPFEDRVFQIDRECYILYLGFDRDDEKPFLRLGNSRALPPGISDFISTILIADDITGNPMLEPLNLGPHTEGPALYLGGRTTLGHYIRLLGDMGVTDARAGTLEKVSSAHDRAEVLFYTNGNIGLMYDRKVLFDLKKREREDGHLRERARYARNRLWKDLIHHEPSSLGQRGFMILGGGLFLTGKDGVIATGCPGHCYERLLFSGIDPELLTVLFLSHRPDFLFDFIKQKHREKSGIRVYDLETLHLKNAAPLLKSASRSSFPVTLTRIEEGSEKRVHGFGIKFYHQKILVDRIFPETLLFSQDGRKEKNGYTLSPDGVLKAGGKSSRRIAEGVLYLVRDGGPDAVKLLRACRDDLPVMHTLETGPSRFAESAARFFDAFRRNTGEFSHLKSGLNAIARDMKKQVKKLSPCGGTNILLHNLSALCSVLIRSGTYGELERLLRDMEKFAERSMTVLHPYIAPIPLLGEVWTGNGVLTVFYRPAGRNQTSDAARLHRETLETVRAGDEDKARFYENERERLRLLLADLAFLPAAIPAKRKTAEEERSPQGNVVPRVRSLSPEGTRPRRGGKKRSLIRKADVSPRRGALSPEGTRPRRGVLSQERTPQSGLPGGGKKRSLIRKADVSPRRGVLSPEGTRPRRGGKKRSLIGKADVSPRRGALSPEGTYEDERRTDGLYYGPSDERARARRFLLPACLGGIVVIGAAVFFIFFSHTLTPPAGTGGTGTDEPAVVGEAVQDTGAGGEGEPEAEGPDETDVQAQYREMSEDEREEAARLLREKNIPHSTLTSNRTVLYRGRIEITVLDIYILTNGIAASNGYNELDGVSGGGKDPDWIFPDNLLTLPDESVYRIVKGDAMWYIAHRFIIQGLERDWDRFSSIIKEIDREGANTDNSDEFLTELREMRDRSYSRNFTREIEVYIEKLTGG